MFQRRDRARMSRKACGDTRTPRRVRLSTVALSIADISLSNDAYIQRWNAFKDSSSSFLPFEVQAESDLFTKKQGIPAELSSLDELAANATHSVLAEATSAPAPRRMSNPQSCPPRLRTRGIDEGVATIHPRVVVPEESEGRSGANRQACEASGEKGVNESALCELFEAYCSEMEKRKARLEGRNGGVTSRFDEIQAATHSFHQDAEELTAHFVEMLKQRGVNTDMLDNLCASLQFCVCSNKTVQTVKLSPRFFTPDWLELELRITSMESREDIRFFTARSSLAMKTEFLKARRLLMDRFRKKAWKSTRKRADAL